MIAILAHEVREGWADLRTNLKIPANVLIERVWEHGPSLGAHARSGENDDIAIHEPLVKILR